MKKYQVIVNNNRFAEISNECDIESALAQSLPFDGVSITQQSYMHGDGDKVSVDIVFNVEVDETKIDEPINPLNELCRAVPFDGIIIKLMEE